MHSSASLTRPAVATAFVCVVVTACGVGSAPAGPEAQAIFAEYTAVWVLDTLASDPPPSDGRLAGGSRRDDDPFSEGAGSRDPFGGRVGVTGGGVPGRLGRGFGGPAGRRGANLEVVRSALALGGARPLQLRLEVSDTLFVISEADQGPIALPMDGSQVDLVPSRWPTAASLSWDGLVPSYARLLEGGARITDRFELLTRDRLLVVRRIEADLIGQIEARFVYDRGRG